MDQQPPFDDLPRERLEVSRSAVRSLSGGEVTVALSMVQNLLAAQADVAQSAVISAQGNRLSLNRSAVALAFGREVQAENSRAILLVTPSLRGNIRPVITLPGAFALGLGFFCGRWLLKSIGRLLKG